MKKHTTWIFAILLVWGCQGKGKECNEVVGVLNPIMTQFDEFADFNPQNAEEAKTALGKMVDLAEKCDQDLDALEINTQELQSYVDRYRTMCAEVAAASREMVAHLEEQQKIEPDIEETQSNLQEAAGKFQKACNEAKDASACKTVTEKLEEMPEDPVAQMDKHKKMVDELKAIEIENEEIEAAVSDLIAVQERLLEIVKKTAQIEKEMEQTEKKIDSATANEDKLASELTAFCQA